MDRQGSEGETMDVDMRMRRRRRWRTGAETIAGSVVASRRLSLSPRRVLLFSDSILSANMDLVHGWS